MKYIKTFENYSTKIDPFNRFYEITSEFEDLKRRYPPQIKYRDIHKEITFDNYYISTKTTFNNLLGDGLINPSKKERDEKWNEIGSIEGIVHKKSPLSSSEYYLDYKTGDIYRLSDHWGTVASCFWKLNTRYKTEHTIGKSNIKNFEIYIDPFDHPSSFITNPKYKDNVKLLLPKCISELKDLRKTIKDGNTISGFSQDQINHCLSKVNDKIEQYDFILYRFSK